MNKQKRKLKRKHLIAMGLIAFIIGLASPTYALRYDLQPYTTCTNGQCSTSLDVSTLGLNTAKINALKTVNITNFLTKSGIINNFQYSWNGNTLTITGRVNDNVYWSFAGGGDTFDPWWNYTTTPTYTVPNNAYNLIALPMSENTSTVAYDKSSLLRNNCTFQAGSEPSWASGKYDTALSFTATKWCNVANNSAINPTGNFTIMAWIKTSGDNMVIWDSYCDAAATHGTMLGVGTVVSGKLQLFNTGISGSWIASSGSVNDNNWHHVAVSYNSAPLKCYFYIDGAASGDADCPGAMATQNTCPSYLGKRTGQAFVGLIDEFKLFNTTLSQSAIQNEMNTAIYFNGSVNVYYVTELYLNGNQTNITMDNATALLIIAYNNLTLNSSIYVNGTLRNNTISNASYTSFLPSGLYNITGYYFNASTNSSVTWWANMTYTAPAATGAGVTATVSIDLNAAPLTCLNTTHAVRNSTFINNGTSTPLAELYFCTDGCDNVTNSGCMPPKWQTNLWVLVIVTIIIIALYKVYRWV